MKPVFKYFGSKNTAAKRYPAPRHSVVLEPFAGGLGYSLHHFDCIDRIYARDIGKCQELLRAISEITCEEISSIPLGLPVGVDIRLLGADLGFGWRAQLLLRSWQRTNGWCWSTSAWCNLPGQWTATTKARLLVDIPKLQRKLVVVDDLPAFASREDVTWFIDPPYQYNYAYGVKDFDYEKLAEDVLTYRGQVIAVEGEGKHGERPSYLPFVSAFSTQQTMARGRHTGKVSNELVFLSGCD